MGEVFLKKAEHVPLAERLRPKSWEDFEGLDKIDAKFLANLRQGKSNLVSLVFWGPPGSGKTTLAHLIGNSYACKFITLSAVLSGVKDIREVVAGAKELQESEGKQTLLFVDEIHRFNKGQQDAFLPHVEAGTIILIGATTENPSFYLTSALLSRLKVLVLPELSADSLSRIAKRAEQELGLQLSAEAKNELLKCCAGDARRLLNIMQELSFSSDLNKEINLEQLRALLNDVRVFLYDRDGEEHYNVASAFIKSMRGSDADAALYWGFRMIAGGEDPRFVIRRMIIFASEDISNADPRALQLAVATADAFERVGMPEGRIPIAHCITYLACAPKSNRSYLAMHQVIAELERNPSMPVPMHLRNAPTGLMESLDYGKDYRYAHNEPDAYVPGEQYLPDSLQGRKYYIPSDRGYEKTMAERLNFLKGRKS